MVLEVKNLSVNYEQRNKTATALHNVSFGLERGEILGVVGESGCGKTTLMLALLRLLPHAGRIVGGQVLFEDQDMLRLNERDMSNLRWKGISIIFQGAMNALNPVRNVGDQIAETIRRHEPDVGKAAVSGRVDHLLELVGIGKNRKGQYPHQYSGGMRQRAMIAMALACNPKVIIADEPTTALDVMIQGQILELLAKLRDELGLSVILVTHDLGVVAELCDSVLVLYAGVTAEYADVDTLFNNPQHPYTQQLLKAFPDIAHPLAKLESIPGYPPKLDALPKGCRFAPRCQKVFERCQSELPKLYQVNPWQHASCFLASEAESKHI
jgi:oligopeptide/dipeptide ABC transporter ATP-binding protein